MSISPKGNGPMLNHLADNYGSTCPISMFISYLERTIRVLLITGLLKLNISNRYKVILEVLENRVSGVKCVREYH